MLNSPISWVGGKSRLRNEIVRRIPGHHTYVEVYCGAAWVLFAKEPSKVEIINDINGELANFWRVVRERPLELVEKLRFRLISQEDFNREKDLYALGGSETDRAERFFWILKGAYASRLIKPNFGYSVQGKSRFDLQTLKAAIQPIHDRLSRVYVFCEDFEKLIRRLDRSETFFYLDPPYMQAPGCYEHDFSQGDHERLARLLKTLSGSFLLSYDDCAAVRALYFWATIEEVRTRYSASRDSETVGHELLIRNYALPKGD